MYAITSFGLVYLTAILGNYGIWTIALPVSIGFLWGVNHFIKLEKIENSILVNIFASKKFYYEKICTMV